MSLPSSSDVAAADGFDERESTRNKQRPSPAPSHRAAPATFLFVGLSEHSSGQRQDDVRIKEESTSQDKRKKPANSDVPGSRTSFRVENLIWDWVHLSKGFHGFEGFQVCLNRCPFLCVFLRGNGGKRVGVVIL